jgi:hypothetical protein
LGLVGLGGAAVPCAAIPDPVHADCDLDRPIGDLGIVRLTRARLFVPSQYRIPVQCIVIVLFFFRFVWDLGMKARNPGLVLNTLIDALLCYGMI